MTKTDHRKVEFSSIVFQLKNNPSVMNPNQDDEHESVGNSLGSVTDLYKLALAGDSQAPAALWERYSKRLFGLARAVLRQRGICPAHSSEDSVVNEAFAKFFESIAKGRYHEVADRHELWHLLATMTRNHALNQAKRHGKTPIGTSDVNTGEYENDWPNPLDVAAVSDTIESLEQRIRDHSKTDQQASRIIRVMQMTLCGYTQREIAEDISQSEVTVRRNLSMIRQLMPVES